MSTASPPEAFGEVYRRSPACFRNDQPVTETRGLPQTNPSPLRRVGLRPRASPSSSPVVANVGGIKIAPVSFPEEDAKEGHMLQYVSDASRKPLEWNARMACDDFFHVSRIPLFSGTAPTDRCKAPECRIHPLAPPALRPAPHQDARSEHRVLHV
jgi:hypothetical protein